jgi:hypothetical protein
MKPRRLTHLQVLRGHDPEAEEQFDLDFWLSVPPEMRVHAALEAMHDYWRIKGIPPQRLRRVLRVVKRQPRSSDG